MLFQDLDPSSLLHLGYLCENENRIANLVSQSLLKSLGSTIQVNKIAQQTMRTKMVLRYVYLPYKMENHWKEEARLLTIPLKLKASMLHIVINTENRKPFVPKTLFQDIKCLFLEWHFDIDYGFADDFVNLKSRLSEIAKLRIEMNCYGFQRGYVSEMRQDSKREQLCLLKQIQELVPRETILESESFDTSSFFLIRFLWQMLTNLKKRSCQFLSLMTVDELLEYPVKKLIEIALYENSSHKNFPYHLELLLGVRYNETHRKIIRNIEHPIFKLQDNKTLRYDPFLVDLYADDAQLDFEMKPFVKLVIVLNYETLNVPNAIRFLINNSNCTFYKITIESDNQAEWPERLEIIKNHFPKASFVVSTLSCPAVYGELRRYHGLTIKTNEENAVKLYTNDFIGIQNLNRIKTKRRCFEYIVKCLC